MQLTIQTEITTTQQTFNRSHKEINEPNSHSPFNQQLSYTKQLNENSSEATSSVVTPPFSAATINTTNAPTSQPKPKRKSKERQG